MTQEIMSRAKSAKLDRPLCLSVCDCTERAQQTPTAILWTKPCYGNAHNGLAFMTHYRMLAGLAAKPFLIGLAMMEVIFMAFPGLCFEHFLSLTAFSFSSLSYIFHTFTFVASNTQVPVTLKSCFFLERLHYSVSAI